MTSDFSKQKNLIGRSFKGQNLSGASFRDCDIRGADFSNSILINADFTNTRAGISPLIQWISALFILVSIVAIGLAIAESAYSSLPVVVVNAGPFTQESLLKAKSSIQWSTGLYTLAILVVFICLSLFYEIRKAFTTILSLVSAIFIASMGYTILKHGILSFAGTFLESIGRITTSITPILLFVVLLFLHFLFFTIVKLKTTSLFISFAATIFGGNCLIDSIRSTGNVSDDVIFYIYLVSSIIFMSSIYACLRILKYPDSDQYAVIRDNVISLISIKGTTFKKANLDNATFCNSFLNNTDFRESTIIRTNWKGSKGLDQSRVGTTILRDYRVRKLLSDGDGRHRNFHGIDLNGAFLSEMDLAQAYLADADLSNADLAGANLAGANLSRAKLMGASLYNAKLNSACIESWNINNKTNLDSIICDCVYLLNANEGRLPSSGKFLQGDFTKLFNKVVNTIDLIFHDAVDWKAFTTVLNKIQVENNGAKLSVQAIEDKGDGMIVVRVNIPDEANRNEIHRRLTEEYQVIATQLDEKNENIKFLNGLVKTLAENRAMVYNFDQRGANLGVNIANEGSVIKFVQYAKQDAGISEKDIIESVERIQILLEKLTESYPVDTEQQQQNFINKFLELIESTPNIIKVLLAGSVEGLKVLCPPAGIPVEMSRSLYEAIQKRHK